LFGRYSDALLAETEKRLAEISPEGTGKPEPAAEVEDRGSPPDIPSMYIGGGTPSVLGASGITRLLEALADLTAGAAEITVEANPETADDAFLKACRLHGVTRLSLGVQSFDDAVRRAAGRQGSSGLLPERLAAASEIFGEGLSLDLMSGLPGQTREILLEDIEKALAFHPGHISLYDLMVEEGTPLALKTAGRSFFSGEDEADQLWLAGRDALIEAGYEQYEVSNFALPGRRSAHNIQYWRMENWLGIGPAASGTVISEAEPLGRRITYIPDVEAFIADPASCRRTEELDRLTLLKESFLMGFRYSEGPNTELFKRRFGFSVEEAVPRTLEKWRGKLKPGKTALTTEGLLFLNRFLLDCFEELEAYPR
jgi:oxygen-independent coproporphyrinogen-3 oxidase